MNGRPVQALHKLRVFGEKSKGRVRDAQNIISQGLDPMLLQFKAIEAFMELSKSNNAKVIITDGKGLPMMINPVDITGAAPVAPGSVSSSGVRVRN